MQDNKQKFNWKLPLYGAIGFGIGEAIWFSITGTTTLLVWWLVGGAISGLLLGAALGLAFKDKKKILYLSGTCALGGVIGIVILYLFFGGMDCSLMGLPILGGVVGTVLGLVFRDRRKIPYLFVAGVFGSVMGIVSVVMFEDFINYHIILWWDFKGFFIIGSITGASLGFMLAYVIKEEKNLMQPKHFLYPLMTILLIVCAVLVLPESLMVPEWSYQLDNDTKNLEILDLNLESGNGVIAYSNDKIYAFDSEGEILWITMITDNRSIDEYEEYEEYFEDYDDYKEYKKINIFGPYIYGREKDLVASARVRLTGHPCQQPIYLGIDKSGKFKCFYKSKEYEKTGLLDNRSYSYRMCCYEYDLFIKEEQDKNMNHIYIYFRK